MARSNTAERVTSAKRAEDKNSQKPGADKKRDRSYEPGELRQALVEEGRRMFEENGATELSLRALARRLGVSEAAPFRHFRGKEELLAAIASSGFRELAAQRGMISAQQLPALPKAREMMLSYVRFAMAHAGLFDLMIGPRILEEFRHGELNETGQISYDYFSRAVADLARECGWPNKTFEYLSHAAWSMEHGIAALILAARIPRENSTLKLQDVIEFSIDFFLDGIVAGPGRNEDAKP
jgi:AcrR family transcriptional regulator